jgi:hypothetical protein
MNQRVRLRWRCEMKGFIRMVLLYLVLLSLGGCAGAIVEQTSDVAIAVVKIPFKIGQALAGLVVGKDEGED